MKYVPALAALASIAAAAGAVVALAPPYELKQAASQYRESYGVSIRGNPPPRFVERLGCPDCDIEVDDIPFISEFGEPRFLRIVAVLYPNWGGWHVRETLVVDCSNVDQRYSAREKLAVLRTVRRPGQQHVMMQNFAAGKYSDRSFCRA